MNDSVVLKALIEESKDGEWGKVERTDDATHMAVIRGTDFEDVRVGEIDGVPQRYIPTHIARRKTIRPNDILIETAGGSKDRPTGRTVLVKQSVVSKSHLPMTCASFARFIRVHQEKVHPAYLFWLLQHLYNTEVLRQYHTQHTGVARFQFTTFSEREPLSLPSPEVQKRVASILSAYDDLIENNTRRIKILEEMAQMLYREWFVNFRFPGHENVKMVESELGSIPEHWTVMKVGEIADVKGGKRLPQGKLVQSEATDHPYIRVKDMLSSGIDLSEIKYIDGDTHRAIRRYTITSNDIYISIAGTIGRVGIVPQSLSGANLTENAAKIANINGLDKLLLLAYLRSEDGQAQIMSKVAGTSQPKLALYKIEQISVVVPPLSLQHRACHLIDAFQKEIECLNRTNNNLRTTRDLLLPKLISCEISVEAAEETAADLVEQTA
jgi:type I restriction enzyme S subunit